jgi:hypothetical protein
MTTPDSPAPDSTVRASFGMTDERSRQVTADLLKATAPG